MRHTLAKGHSVSDSTSWAYALLVVLLAAPVLAAVVVLVTMVGQTETNRVPVQASGSGGQSVPQDVRPVIVMQRVSRGAVRRPGAGADPVGRQVASPATLHERIDRFTSLRREPTRRRRGDSPAGVSDPVPYPSSSWPAVAPPLMETPGVTRPDSHTSGGLGREASAPRSWGQWVRSLVELTLPSRQVFPPVGAKPGAVSAIVVETPEIPARAEGGYLLPPVRVRAGLAGTDGLSRFPLMVSAIAEIEAGPDVSRHEGADPRSSKSEFAVPDADGFELALVPAVIDQANQIQMSFLVADPDSIGGLVISEPSLHDLTRLAPVLAVVASVGSDLAETVASTGSEVELVADGSDMVLAAPAVGVEVLVAEADSFEAELRAVERVVAGSAQAMPVVSRMTNLEEALVAEADPVGADPAVATAAPVMSIEPVMAEVEEALVAEADPVEAEPDAAIAEPVMAIEHVMADVEEATFVASELVEVELVYPVTTPVMANEHAMAEVVEGPAVASGLLEGEPVYAIPAPELAIEPVPAEVDEALVTEADPSEVEHVQTEPDPVMAFEPVDAEVVVELVYATPVQELPIEPVVPEIADGSASDREIGADHVSLGVENQRVVDAWAAMTQVETVDMATPSGVGLELEPFVDVPVTAFAYEVDGNRTDALVTPEEDECPEATGPSDPSGAELSLTGTDVLGSGKFATDEADLRVNGLDCEEEVGPEDQEPTFTSPPVLPVEEPQPAWMPLPRSPKFRWVRVAMQATEVTVPRDVFAGQ